MIELKGSRFDSQLGLKTQAHYEATSDVQVNNCKNAVISIGWGRLFPQEWSEVGWGEGK